MSYIRVSGIRGRPGNALIEIGYALNVDPLRFTLQRTGADQRYLGSDGRWRADAEPLVPESVERRDGRTFLGIGPNIVDQINEDERVHVEIVSAGFAADMVWSNVAPSARRAGGSVFVTPKPAPAPEPTPTPVVAEKAPDPQPEPEPPKVDPTPETKPFDRRIVFGIIGLALVLVICAGTAAWYYRSTWLAWFEAKIPEPPPTPPPGPVPGPVPGPDTTTTPTPTPNPNPGPTLGPTPPPTPVPNVAAEEDRLRQELANLMRDDGDAAKMLEGGRKLLDSQRAELRDFGFRAVDRASQKGSPAARLELGKLYDPRYFKVGRGGMDKANPSIAAEFYRQAKDGGSREAEDELKGLCTLLAQPSADIDERVRVSTTEQYCR